MKNCARNSNFISLLARFSFVCTHVCIYNLSGFVCRPNVMQNDEMHSLSRFLPFCKSFFCWTQTHNKSLTHINVNCLLIVYGIITSICVTVGWFIHWHFFVVAVVVWWILCVNAHNAYNYHLYTIITISM